MTEEWREVVGYPRYEVSSLGRVRNKTNGRVLKTPLTNWGYPHTVVINKAGKKTRLVHQMVCEAFHCSQPFPGAEIRHLDGDKLNARPENLQWGTRAENCADRIRFREASHGSQHTQAKLTEGRVEEILQVLGTTTQTEISRRFQISGSVISEIKLGKAWKHVLRKEPTP